MNFILTKIIRVRNYRKAYQPISLNKEEEKSKHFRNCLRGELNMSRFLWLGFGALLKLRYSSLIDCLLLIEFLQTLHVKWVEQYGRIYRTWRGRTAIVAISSPQHIEVFKIISFFFMERYGLLSLFLYSNLAPSYKPEEY
jgi:hypothetical protein